jgi:hypothetical protein
MICEGKNSLKGYTMSNPVHTSETRMCGGKNIHPLSCLEGSTSSSSQSGTALQADEETWGYLIRGHPLLRRVCPRLLIV